MLYTQSGRDPKSTKYISTVLYSQLCRWVEGQPCLSPPGQPSPVVQLAPVWGQQSVDKGSLLWAYCMPGYPWSNPCGIPQDHRRGRWPLRCASGTLEQSLQLHQAPWCTQECSLPDERKRRPNCVEINAQNNNYQLLHSPVKKIMNTHTEKKNLILIEFVAEGKQLQPSIL